MGVYGSKTDSRTIKYTFPSATAVAAGDLLYDNSGVAAKASAQADQGSESLNQRLFARRFLGVAGDSRLAGETGTAARTVETEAVKQYDCPSTTWAVGDLVAASENSGGDALLNQQVEKTTDPEAAIGVCVEAGTSLTKVWVNLTSRVAPPNGINRDLAYASYYFTGTPAATDQAFFVAPYACRVVAISQVHSVAAGGTSTLQVVKDTGTSAPGAGTDLLATPFDLNATANTVQNGSLSATAADLVLAPGDRLSVDFAHLIQSTAGLVVTVALAPLTAG